ncbi:hypothetical protein EHO58_19005 [Leptospira selangorensis]|uniref:hypothetical protein n=1 Tax=Leptospira selangorensis TaxID=2484982 RepID=UPI001083C184|nr:hypothetical protein [Leptospira selangorensis]TGK00540.1 hypothetical protein EHO58_19005 [Leptospira selangorensis]
MGTLGIGLQWMHSTGFFIKTEMGVQNQIYGQEKIYIYNDERALFGLGRAASLAELELLKAGASFPSLHGLTYLSVAAGVSL